MTSPGSTRTPSSSQIPHLRKGVDAERERGVEGVGESCGVEKIYAPLFPIPARAVSRSQFGDDEVADRKGMDAEDLSEPCEARRGGLLRGRTCVRR
jgi:hypothetical protein